MNSEEKIAAEAKRIASGLTDPMRATLASMLTKIPIASPSTWYALDRRGLIRWDPRAEGRPCYVLTDPLGWAVAEQLRSEGWG